MGFKDSWVPKSVALQFAVVAAPCKTLDRVNRENPRQGLLLHSLVYGILAIFPFFLHHIKTAAVKYGYANEAVHTALYLILAEVVGFALIFLLSLTSCTLLRFFKGKGMLQHQMAVISFAAAPLIPVATALFAGLFFPIIFEKMGLFFLFSSPFFLLSLSIAIAASATTHYISKFKSAIAILLTLGIFSLIATSCFEIKKEEKKLDQKELSL